MNNFTLIIPTHNRHNYLKRSMEYYKSLDAHIIYCDSSSEKYNGKLSNNIKYLHLPNKQFAEKILIALKAITTNYVALCADDDFILINSLYKGAAFLSINKNYSTIVGKYIAFKEKFDGNYYKRYQEPPKDIDFCQSKNAEIFFRHYYQILWAMYDKEVLTKSFHIINQAQFQNDNFIELVIGACACYKGGLKFLNEIWGVRELNVTDHWGAKHNSITNNKSVENKQDYQNFKELLDKDTSIGFADLVIINYFQFQKRNEKSYKSIIKMIIPKILLRLIKKLTQRTHSQTLQTININSLEANRLIEITTILNSNNIFKNN